MVEVDAPDLAPADSELNIESLSRYLRAGIPDLTGDVHLFRFPAGHSNLTFFLRSGDRDFVLKCAPPGAKAKSAHDMGREYKVLSRLHGKYPFSPNAFLYCNDPAVIGTDFCVMERIRGAIIRSQYPAEAGITPDVIGRQFMSLISGLADLHAINVAEVGLSDLGRPLGYRQRQFDGWQKRLEAARTDDMVDFDEVTQWLASHMPQEPEASAIVHNDFKMDNLVWDPSDITKLVGVLDWEMSTNGDPLMDLSCTISFWVQADDPAEFRALRAMPSARPGVMSRREAVAYYAKRSGRRIDNIDFYLCFGLFRRAVIEQQKYARYRRGDTQDSRFSNLDGAVRVLRDMCVAVTQGRM